MLTNFGNEALTVSKATVLAIAEKISECIVDKIKVSLVLDIPTDAHGCDKNKAPYQKLRKAKLDHLPSHERQLIGPVLIKYDHVFLGEELNDFQANNVVEYEIPIEDKPPVRRPPYRTPYALRDKMKTQVEKC